jgi:hypothetical protein
VFPWITAISVVVVTSAPSPAGAVDERAVAGIEEAFAAYERGRARFEIADYGGAIKEFARAYQGLPNTPEHDARRRGVLWELVQAHLRAHVIDRDVVHLRLVRDLLARYLEALDPQLGEERRAAEALASENDVKLRLMEDAARASATPAVDEAACELGEDAAGACARDVVSAVRYEPRRPLPEGPAEAPGPSMLDVGKVYQRPELMLATGGVLIGLGAMAGVLAVFSGVQVNQAIEWWQTDYDKGEDAKAQFDLYHPLMIGMAVAGGLLAVGGGALLGVGLRRKRTLRLALHSPAGRFGERAPRVGIMMRW